MSWPGHIYVVRRSEKQREGNKTLCKVKTAQRMHGIFDKLKDILDTNINESR